MSIRYSPAYDPARAAADKVLYELLDHGFISYLAGGCVRDTILGRQPKDYDVATAATPNDIEHVFEKTLPIGKDFGVMQVIMDGHAIEVATFRADGNYSDNRRPDTVQYSRSPEADVQRRDFTINGMMMGVSVPGVQESILDFVGGKEDLSKRLIRAIGDPEARFGEDALRMLRAVRFACQLGFEIETKTFNAIRLLADNIVAVSQERKRDEIQKIFVSGRAGLGFYLLHVTGLLERLFSSLVQDNGFEVLNRLHFLPKDCDPLLGWASLELSAPQRDKLRLKKKDLDRIGWLVETEHRFDRFELHNMASKVKLMRSPNFELGLQALKHRSSYSAISTYEQTLKAASEVPKDLIKAKPWVNGNDLLAMGAKSSKLFGPILTAVENLQLDGELTSKEQALEWIRKTHPGLFLEGSSWYAKICLCGAFMKMKAENDSRGNMTVVLETDNVGRGRVMVKCKICRARHNKKTFKRMDL